jgi:formylmethanofuran dehydrogenase subunit C
MSATVFRLRDQPSQRCDLSPLTPDRLAAVASVDSIAVGTTRRRLTVGDLFEVTPGDPLDIRFEGGSERFDNVGLGMSIGRISVVGDVGLEVGRAMRGGEIDVSGDAGRLAGSGMSGGRLEIGGSAGDLVGGPLPGEMAGMRGGLIRVRGDAGDRVGDRMRRGLIVVEGHAGAATASRMIGGTIVCFGRAGPHPGTLMKRGTVILGGGADDIAPTFPDSGVHELVAMRLIARWLIDEGIEGASLLAWRLRRLVGDTAVRGKGELFVPVEASG